MARSLRASFGEGDEALRRTQFYARLFMVPGMYHCSGGPGPNTFDALTPLDPLGRGRRGAADHHSDQIRQRYPARG